MSHDTSIHIYEVGDKLTGEEFAAYMQRWGCAPLQHVTPNARMNGLDGGIFTCIKEVNGYQETWDVTSVEPDGRINELMRRA